MHLIGSYVNYYYQVLLIICTKVYKLLCHKPRKCDILLCRDIRNIFMTSHALWCHFQSAFRFIVATLSKKNLGYNTYIILIPDRGHRLIFPALEKCSPSPYVSEEHNLSDREHDLYSPSVIQIIGSSSFIVNVLKFCTQKILTK